MLLIFFGRLCLIHILVGSGVSFINVLRAAFAQVDPKSVKRYWGFDWILMLLGSMTTKAVRRTLMNLSPDLATASSEINTFMGVPFLSDWTNSFYKIHQLVHPSSISCASLCIKDPNEECRCQFHQRSTSSSCTHRSQKHKKMLTTLLNSYAFKTYKRKSCT